MTPIRLGLVGAGNIARAGHLPALAVLKAEGLVEVTVFDAQEVNRERVSSEFGFAVGSDWRSGDVDALSLCVPPGPNAEIAAEALAGGLHVLSEKPPARNPGQARVMRDAAQARPDRISMIGFNRRFNPLVCWARAQGESIGPPTSFVGRFSRAAIGESPSNTASDWITADSCHTLDLAIAVMGFPTAVGVGRRVVGSGPDNVWALQLHAPNGPALLHFNYAAADRVESLEWVGPAYEARLVLPGAATWQQMDSARTELALGPDVPFHEANGFLAQYRAFLAAVRGDGPRPECDFAYGSRFMELVAAILDAPSGSLCEIAPEPTPGGTPSATTPAVEVRTPGRSGRPVVAIHHALADHPHFFPPEKLEELATHCEIRPFEPGTDRVRDVRVLITGRGADYPSPEALAGATELELFIALGASVVWYQPEQLLARGIAICNTGDALARLVAEHCLMVMLAGLRQLLPADRRMRTGGWLPGVRAPRRNIAKEALTRLRELARRLPIPLPVKERAHRLLVRGGDNPTRKAPVVSGPGAPSELRGQTIGLLGWGDVARHVTELLTPFACEILVWSENADPDELIAAGARPASLGEILRTAKVISLHRGLNDTTRGFVDAAVLDQIPSGRVLVNTARGELIDEGALIERLRRGDIVAALDVYDEEPLPANHPLRSIDNTILTPHAASTTEQEDLRMGEQALDYAIAWATGGAVPTISADRLARMT